MSNENYVYNSTKLYKNNKQIDLNIDKICEELYNASGNKELFDKIMKGIENDVMSSESLLKTSFEHLRGLNNCLGGYFLTVYSDKKTGNVEYIAIEERQYGKKDIWDEAGKDRNKVKQLVIK